MTERSNFSTTDGVRKARKGHFGRYEHPGYDKFQKSAFDPSSKSTVPSVKKPRTKPAKKNPQYGQPINLTPNEDPNMMNDLSPTYP